MRRALVPANSEGIPTAVRAKRVGSVREALEAVHISEA